MKRKSNFSSFLLGAGSVLVALFAVDEIFLFLRELNLLPIRIEETVIIYLTMTPVLAVLLYSMISVFVKTKSYIKTFFAGGIGVLLAIITLSVFYILMGFLIYAVCAAMIIIGIVLTAYGFRIAESSGSYGILCINAVYFALNSFILAMSASSGTRAVWAVILLPVLCALIIIDMVSVSKIEKSKAEKTLQEAK